MMFLKIRKLISIVPLVAVFGSVAFSTLLPLTASAQTYQSGMHWYQTRSYSPGEFTLKDSTGDKFVFKPSGNLVFYVWNGFNFHVKWQSNTRTTAQGYLSLQHNGNITLHEVLSSSQDFIIWQSHSDIPSRQICGSKYPYYLNMDVNHVYMQGSYCLPGYINGYEHKLAS